MTAVTDQPRPVVDAWQAARSLRITALRSRLNRAIAHRDAQIAELHASLAQACDTAWRIFPSWRTSPDALDVVPTPDGAAAVVNRCGLLLAARHLAEHAVVLAAVLAAFEQEYADIARGLRAQAAAVPELPGVTA